MLNIGFGDPSWLVRSAAIGHTKTAVEMLTRGLNDPQELLDESI